MPSAGLPVIGSIVGVGPPLEPSAPSLGSANATPGTHAVSAPPPTVWFIGNWRLSLPVAVTWHCIGAPGLLPVLLANSVLSMVSVGLPKIAAPNPSTVLFANVAFVTEPLPPNRQIAP